MKEVMIGVRNLCHARRKAGKVKRFHTEFLIQPPQTLSDHVFNMLRIWTSIWGAPPPEVTMEIMYHDFEELFIGDMPHWTHCQPKFRDLAEELNHEIRKELGAPLETFNWRIRLVDQIEAIEFMLDEVLLGNYILQDKLHGLARKVYKALLELPVEEATKIYAYFDDMGNIGLLKEREHDTI